MTLVLLQSPGETPVWDAVRAHLQGIPVAVGQDGDPAVVVGHSAGAVAALSLALARPGRVLGLGLVAPDLRTSADLERLWELRCRTQILVGSDDAVSPPSYTRMLAERISAARLVEYAGAGHMLPLERPAEVAGELAVLWAASLAGRVTPGRGGPSVRSVRAAGSPPREG